MLNYHIPANFSVKGDQPYKNSLIPSKKFASIPPLFCPRSQKNTIIDNQSLTIQKSPSEEEK